MYRMEKDNVVRYAADEKKRRKLLELGYKDAAENTAAPVKKKRSAADGRDEA